MGKLSTQDSDEKVFYSPTGSVKHEVLHRGNFSFEFVLTSKAPEKGLVSGKYYNFGNVTSTLNLKFAPTKIGYIGIWTGEFILQGGGSINFPYNVKWPEDTPKLEVGYRYMFRVINDIGTITKIKL